MDGLARQGQCTTVSDNKVLLELYVGPIYGRCCAQKQEQHERNLSEVMIPVIKGLPCAAVHQGCPSTGVSNIGFSNTALHQMVLPSVCRRLRSADLCIIVGSIFRIGIKTRFIQKHGNRNVGEGDENLCKASALFNDALPHIFDF